MINDSLVNAIDKEENREKRIISIGSDDLDAVRRNGNGKIIHDTHNFENIGRMIEFQILGELIQ